MELSTLQAHVAYSAGQAKRQGVMTGASTVIDILQVAGLLKEEGGKLVVSSEGASQQDALKVDEQINRDQISLQADTATMPSTILQNGNGGIGLAIQLQIQCSVDDIQSLGPKIRALLKDLSQPVAQDESNADKNDA